MNFGYIDVTPHAEKRMAESGFGNNQHFLIRVMRNAMDRSCCTIYRDTEKDGKQLYCRDLKMGIAFKKTYDARHRNMKTVVKSAFKVGDPEGRYVESDRFEEI